MINLFGRKRNVAVMRLGIPTLKVTLIEARILQFLLFSVLIFVAGILQLVAQERTQTHEFRNYETVFNLGKDKVASTYKVTVLGSNAPGHIFEEGEQVEFKLQIENLTDKPLRGNGVVEVIRYGTFYDSDYENSWWEPSIRKIAEEGKVSLKIDLESKGWKDITIKPQIPKTKGGYALILDLGEHGRHYIASLIRTYKHKLENIQFPVQSLEVMDPAILARLGVQAIRYGISFEPLNTKRKVEDKPYFEWLAGELKNMHEHKITVMAEIGAGNSYKQPLGRPRPHLDNNDVMQKGKMDYA